MPMRGLNGEIEHFLTIRNDITERKLGEQKMLQSAKMATLGEMAAGIAHEINNPLGIIRGKTLQMYRDLKSGTFNKDNFLSEFEKIETTTMRIADIIKGLRSFSRNANDDPFVRYNLLQIIQDSVELCKSRLKDHGIELRLNCDPDVCISCKPAQISQILLNLLNNAHDAIENLPEKWVELAVHKSGELVEIAVKDSGKGISRKVLDKLMQPFFTTKETGKGTGLGLSISKGMAEDHRGTLRYDYNCANTCFILSLPLSKSESQKAA